MTEMKSRKIAVLAKLQPGDVDAVPTGGANAILGCNPKITPMEADRVERDVVRPYFGAGQEIPVGTRMKAEFEVELAGAGAAGTVPAWGVLMRGCAFAETVTAGTKVEYTPVSDSLEKLSIHYNLDGVNHILLAARGTVSFDLANKKLPKLKFVYTGVYGGIADAALPAVTLTAFQTPVPFTAEHVASFTLHGHSPRVESLSVDIANDVKHRSLPGGAEYVAITDRKPSGSCVIEAVRLAEKDYFAVARSAAAGALSVVHGKVAGNIVELDANVTIGNPDYGDSEGIVTMTLPLSVVPINGNDEFKLTVR